MAVVAILVGVMMIVVGGLLAPEGSGSALGTDRQFIERPLWLHALTMFFLGGGGIVTVIGFVSLVRAFIRGR